MKPLLLFIGVIFAIPCLAQPVPEAPQPRGNQVTAFGATSPDISLEVHALETPIRFFSVRDYSGNQIVPGYFRITVKSPKPWFLSFKSASIDYLNAKKSVHSLVSLQDPITRTQIPLARTSQIILQGPGHVGERDYFIDLILDAPFDILPGIYHGLVDFQVTSE